MLRSSLHAIPTPSSVVHRAHLAHRHIITLWTRLCAAHFHSFSHTQQHTHTPSLPPSSPCCPSSSSHRVPFSWLQYSTTQHRYYARPPADKMLVFDRNLKLAHRDRTALWENKYEYLRDEIATRLIDRIRDINKKFDTCVDLGSNHSNIARYLGDAGEIKTLIQINPSEKLLNATIGYEKTAPVPVPAYRKTFNVVCDEEYLPLLPNSCDMIISNMSLHWVNDLPGVLVQCMKALKPDGVFLGAMLGGETLQELRSAFTLADTERRGGVSAHISPFARGRDVGDLITRAGFNLPTVDWEAITVPYPDMFTLCEHLRGMGESNCVFIRPPAVSRDVFTAAGAIYQELYQDEQGLVPATFEILYMIGWSPAATQPKPLPRGSASHNLADIQAVEQSIAREKKQ